MAQEIYRPGEKLPSEERRSQAVILDESINSLRNNLNLSARLRAHFQMGKNAAEVLVAMQRDVLEAQRLTVQTHANLIARQQGIELTDRFQKAISDITKRVDERTAEETKYYWQKLKERWDYYEEFFGVAIREIQEKVVSGQLTKERGDVRIKKYQTSLDTQQQQDEVLIEELRQASMRIVGRALKDFHPS